MRNRPSVFVVLAAAILLSAARAAAAPVAVSLSFFHDQLAPHGRWVTAASYGSVWIPGGISAHWEPYVDGEWVYSDYGWTWVADDPWGDIPYHYGTWAWVEPYGWVWIPGTVWAPAWVTWAYTDDYIGWAPVPPSFALSVTGYFGPPVVVAATHYVCVPARQFVGVRVSTVRVPAQQSVTIVKRAVKTTRYEVGNGVVRVAGPPTQQVERAIGRPVPRVSVDRLRARPTTLAAGGVVKAKSVRVVAPEKERARLKTEKASLREVRSEPKASSKPAARSETVEKKERPAKVRPESTSARNAREARPGTEPRKSEVERPQPESRPQPERRVEPQKSNAKPEARRVESEKSNAKPQPRAGAPEKSSAPHTGSSARKPESKPRPKPKPPQEREQPQKDSSESHRD
jgi:hypothetical protein